MFSRKTALTFAAGLTLAGCNLAPKYVRPELPVAPSGPTAESVDWESRSSASPGIALAEISQRPTVVWSMPTAEKLTSPTLSVAAPGSPTVGVVR